MQKGGRNAGSKNFDYYDIGTFEDDLLFPQKKSKMTQTIVSFDSKISDSMETLLLNLFFNNGLKAGEKKVLTCSGSKGSNCKKVIRVVKTFGAKPRDPD